MDVVRGSEHVTLHDTTMVVYHSMGLMNGYQITRTRPRDFEGIRRRVIFATDFVSSALCGAEEDRTDPRTRRHELLIHPLKFRQNCIFVVWRFARRGSSISRSLSGPAEFQVSNWRLLTAPTPGRWNLSMWDILAGRRGVAVLTL